MGKIGNILSTVFLAIGVTAFAQDQTMTNTGVTMVIQSGATVYIDGDYEDTNLEDGIVLEGTFEITGDFYNNSNRGALFNPNTVKLDDDGNPNGTVDFSGSGVIFSGSSNQVISGSYASFFPSINANLSVSTNELILDQAIDVRNELTLNTGRINLNGNSITLSVQDGGILVGENEDNYVYGDGFIRKESTAFNVGLVNVGGLGLSMNIGGGSGATISVNRFHQSIGNVADGSIPLNYQVQTPDVGKGISEVDITSYVENPSSTPAIYFSTDQNEWDPYDVSVSGSGFITTAINPTDTTLTLGADSYFTIGVRNCSAANSPTFNIDAEVTISNTPENRNLPKSFAGGQANIDVCDLSDLNLQSSQTFQYYQWTDHSTFEPTVDLNARNVDVVSVSETATYYLLSRNDRGCESEQSITVNARDNPIPSFTIPISGYNVCIDHSALFDATSSSTGDGSSINTYNWDFDDGNTESIGTNTISHAYTDNGRYTTRLDVLTQYGCTNLESNAAFGEMDIYAPPLVEPIIIRLDAAQITESCEFEELLLTSAAQYTDDTDGNATDYQGTSLVSNLQYRWDFGDGSSDQTGGGGTSSVNNIYRFDDFDPNNELTVGLTVEDVSNASGDSYNCISAVTTDVIIHPKPTPLFDVLVEGTTSPAISEICEGVDLEFDNNSSIRDGNATVDAIASYDWDFDNSETSTDTDPTLQYIQEGTYDIELIATSDFGCKDTTNLEFTVYPTPEGAAGTDIYSAFNDGSSLEREDVFCLDETTSFVNGTTIPTPGSIASYEWNFGDGNTSSDVSPEHVYANPGVYPVKLTRTSDQGCSNTTSSFDVTIKDFPTPSFDFVNQCDGSAFSFVNTTFLPDGEDDVTYYWQFGDDPETTSTQKNPLHTYTGIDFGSASQVTFDVTLTVTNATSIAACSESVTETVTVYRNPSFSFPPAVLTFNSEVTLDPTDDAGAYIQPGSDYTWTDNIGNTLSTNPTYDVTFSGPYTLDVVSPDNCGFSDNVVVYFLESVTLGPDQNLCENSTLNASPSGSSILDPQNYRWYKDGSLVQDGANSTLDITESGLYRVEVTYEESGVSATTSDEVNITIDTPIILALDTEYADCDGETISVDADVVADTYSWKNSGGTEIATTRIAQFDQAGDYTLEVTRGACSASQAFEIILNETPTAFYSSTSTESCINEIISFTSFDTNGTITWDFGDGNTGNGATVDHAFETPDSYDVVMTITNSNDCSESFSRTIDVFAYPEVAFSAEDVCQGESITFDNQSTIFGGSVAYEWDFGDGNTSTDENPGHLYENEGTYSVELSINNNGCISSITQTVEIYESPSIGFGAQAVTCGDELTLTSPIGLSYRWYDVDTDGTLATSQEYTATESGFIGLEYTSEDGCAVSEETEVVLNSPIEIDFGTQPLVFCESGVLDAGTFPNATYSWSTGEATQQITIIESGEYTVTVEDINGCDDTETVEVIVHDQPVLNLGPNIAVCDTELPVILQSPTEAESYLWSTGATTASIEVSTSGNYELEVSNGDGACIASDQINVQINESPLADFTFSEVCSGEGMTFQNLHQDNDFDYLWEFGDGNSSPLAEPTHTYQGAGSYVVKLTTTSPEGCRTSVSKEVTVFAMPVPSFNVSDGCVTSSFTFVNNSTYEGDEKELSYLWNLGDGTTAETKDVSHEYASAGSYFVRLTITAASGCSQSILKEVDVFNSPEVDFGDTIRTCDPEVLLDAENEGSTYLWQDNSTAQEFLVAETGTYQVVITNETGCTTTESVYVELLEVSKPNLGMDFDVCGEAILETNIDAVSYLWSTGERTASITTSTSGTYTVQTISEDLCPSSDTVEVIVNTIPVFDLGEDQQTCEGEVISLEISNGDTYLWSSGESTQSIDASESGLVTATAFSDEGCEFTDEIALTFYELPEKPFEESYEACDSLELEAGPFGNSYLWSTGDNERSLTIYESGYFWTQISSPENCVTLDTTFVDIFPSPNIGFEESVETCFGGTTILDVGDQNFSNTIAWNTGETTQAIEVGAPGIYWADVTNVYGCVTRDSIEVIEREKIIVDLGEDFVFCESVELDAGHAGLNYAWTLPDGSNQTTRKIMADIEGVYTLTVTDDFGCSASDEITLTKTTEKVKAHFLAPSLVIAGNRVVFQALSDEAVISYHWDFGDGNFNDENISNPVYRYNTPGLYTITLTYTNGICTETLSKEIEVLPSDRGRVAGKESGDDAQLLFVEILESTIHPNPVQDIATLSIKLNTSAPTHVRVFDLAGYTYMDLEHNIQEEQLGLDFTDYKSGLYFVTVQVGKQKVTEKILKVD